MNEGGLRWNLCDPERVVNGFRFTCAGKADSMTTWACTGTSVPVLATSRSSRRKRCASMSDRTPVPPENGGRGILALSEAPFTPMSHPWPSAVRIIRIIGYKGILDHWKCPHIHKTIEAAVGCAGRQKRRLANG